MKISVVIPAYNEERDIADVLYDVKKYFRHAEIIVVNDASTDKTYEILRRIQRQSKVKNLHILSNNVNKGHGFSVIKGLKAATGKFILYIDADRQIDLALPILRNDFYWDIVTGKRINRQDKAFRKFISFCLRWTIRLKYHYRIQDANCPFKLYRRAAILPLLDQIPNSYIVPIACLQVLAEKDHRVIATIPVFHHRYIGTRKGFLQSLDLKTMWFFIRAFFEVISLS